MNETKIKLIKAAARLFAENGYEQTSIADISNNAKANIAAVNYHFGSKEKLLYEVLDYSQEIAVQKFPLQISGRDEEATPHERLNFFVYNMLQRVFANDEPGYISKIKFSMSPSIQSDEDFFRRYVEKDVIYLEQLISASSQRSFDPMELRICAVNVMSIFKFYASTLNWKAKLVEEYGDNVVKKLAPLVMGYVTNGIESYKKVGA